MVDAKPIQIRQIRKAYNGVDVLQLDDLTIPAGQFICVVGPSGCGKTTLLNLVAGLASATHGEILVDEVSVTAPGPDRGIVFQQYALFPWLTVLDNVAFGLKMRGVEKTERYRQARHYLNLVGLDPYENYYPKHLSGGMMQRAAIARAWIMHPTVLLMDEPFGALDAMTRRELQAELLRWWIHEKQTIIFITHDMDEALFLGERVLIMGRHPGRVLKDVPIDFPYPRGPEIKVSSQFAEYERTLWDCLHDQGGIPTNNGNNEGRWMGVR